MSETAAGYPAESGMKKSVHSILVIVAGVLLLGLLTAIYLNAGYMADWIRGLTGLEYGTITVLQTAMLVVNLVTIPFCGALTLKFSGFKLFVLGYCLCLAGIFGMLLIPTFAGLIICYVILFGFGSAISGYAIVLSVLLPVISEKHAGIAAAALISCGNCISLILFPILQVIDRAAPGGLVFLLLGGLGFVFLPLFFYIFSRKKRVEAEAAASAAAAVSAEKPKTESYSLRLIAKEIFTSRRFYLLCFLSFTFGAIATSPSGNLIHMLEVWYGVDAVDASLCLSLFSLIYVVSGIILGIFMSKIKSKMFYAGVLFGITACIHILCFVENVPLAVAAASVFTIGFLMGAISPSISLLTREWIGAAKFAAAYSIVYLMLRLGGILSTFIGGMDYAFDPTFLSIYTFTEVIAVAAAVFALIAGISEIQKRRRGESSAV
ncbi:MAG: hypothetical protein Q4Q20_04660 [Methanocorpusculum sp.]|nr:hypothetical protein [Methanocorpusculum sp.]